MDFGLNEQQRAMQESFAAYLDDVTSVEKLARVTGGGADA